MHMLMMDVGAMCMEMHDSLVTMSMRVPHGKINSDVLMVVLSIIMAVIVLVSGNTHTK